LIYFWLRVSQRHPEHVVYRPVAICCRHSHPWPSCGASSVLGNATFSLPYTYR
jgi:hypothetical protein